MCRTSIQIDDLDIIICVAWSRGYIRIWEHEGDLNFDEMLCDREDWSDFNSSIESLDKNRQKARSNAANYTVFNESKVESFSFEISVRGTFAGSTTAESLGTIHVHFASNSLQMISFSANLAMPRTI